MVCPAGPGPLPAGLAGVHPDTGQPGHPRVLGLRDRLQRAAPRGPARAPPPSSAAARPPGARLLGLPHTLAGRE
eukprot:7331994-Alexandrium_andersonii.AAC.1